MLERNGTCWGDAFDCLINPPLGIVDFEPVLVHGLPTGQGGEAGKVGVYCHAWIEYPDLCVVYETAIEQVIPHMLYYKHGKINYTKKYTRGEALMMLKEHETFGPWDDKLLARDEEVDKL